MSEKYIPDETELFDRIWKYRRSVQHLEREYLELRVRLRDAEADLRSDAENQELKERVDYFKSRLQDLESRHPWIATGNHSEIPFCISYTA